MNGSDLDRHIFGDYDQPDDLTYGEGYEDGYQEGRADGYSAGYDAAIDALRARAERAEAVVAAISAKSDEYRARGRHNATQRGDYWLAMSQSRLEVADDLDAILSRASQPASEVEQ